MSEIEALISRHFALKERKRMDEMMMRPAKPVHEDVVAEVAAWFRGGRCLETGPEDVTCCLECTRQRRWYLHERCATTGELMSSNEIDERIAWHIILASDVANLMFEQKVMKCLKEG